MRKISHSAGINKKTVIRIRNIPACFVKLLAENGGDLAAAAGTKLPAADDEEPVTLYDFISQQDAPEMAELKAYLKEKLGK